MSELTPGVILFFILWALVVLYFGKLLVELNAATYRRQVWDLYAELYTKQ